MRLLTLDTYSQRAIPRRDTALQRLGTSTPSRSPAASPQACPGANTASARQRRHCARLGPTSPAAAPAAAPDPGTGRSRRALPGPDPERACAPRARQRWEERRGRDPRPVRRHGPAFGSRPAALGVRAGAARPLRGLLLLSCRRYPHAQRRPCIKRRTG